MDLVVGVNGVFEKYVVMKKCHEDHCYGRGQSADVIPLVALLDLIQDVDQLDDGTM